MEKQLQLLEKRITSLERAYTEAFTASKFLRIERVPNLFTDGFELPAGSSQPIIDIAAAGGITELDRWEVQVPTSVAHDVSAAGTTTILNQTEVGQLISIGLHVDTVLVGEGSTDFYLDITTDGGTKRTIALMVSGVAQDGTKPWHVGAVHGFDQLDDCILIYFNLAYATSLLVEFRQVTNATSGSITTTVLRGVKT